MNIVYLSQLDKLVKKHLVFEYYERGIESMCMKEFLPLCAALLYPYRNEKFPLENTPNGNIMPIIESIKSFTNKKNGLEKYCLDGLRKYFQYKWLPTLDFDNQKRLIKGVSLVDKVEKDGFFSLKGNEKVYDTYLHRISVLDISTNYGNESFEIPQETTIEDGDMTDRNVSTDKVSLSVLKDWLLFNFPIDKYPKGLNQFPYFWQYKLAQEQYENLKKILLSLNLKENTNLLRVEPCGKEFGTVARAVALFVSEWYKRECKTLDGDKCLEPIGLTSSNSNQVWTNSGLPDTFLHQENDNNQMRQIAMCALGGLPLNIVNSSERFKKFVNGLFEIYQKQEAIDEDIEYIVNSFDDNNGVFKRSLESGSCKKYLLQLVKYLERGMNSDLPFNERDLGLFLFSKFIKKLQESFDDALRDFFKIDWNFYIESSRSDCECTLNVNIGAKNNRCYIPEKLLNDVNLSDVKKLKEFFLYVDYNNGKKISKLLRFSRSAGNSSPFVGWGNSNVISFPVIPDVGDTISINIVGINDIDRTNPYTLKEFTVNGYFRLFKTNNPYEWSSLTDNKAHSVLLFKPSYYSLMQSEEGVEEKSIGLSHWQLHFLYDDAQLKNLQTGDVLDFKILKGVLSIDFKKLPNVIQYNKNKEITYSYNVDDEILNESMPLMLGENGILKVVFNPFRQGESPKTYKPGKDKDLIIKYKQDTFDYKKFADGLPKTGLIKIQVSDGKQSVVKKCFFVSNPNFVIRDLENSHFAFNLNDAEVFQADDEKLAFDKESDKIVFYEDKDYLPHLDYLTFNVGTKNDYANVNVYRARECREMYFEDHRFTEYGNSKEQTKIPFVLREKFRIRTINKDGVENIFCGRDVWMNPDVNLQTINDDFNSNSLDKNFIIDLNNGIVYYQYLSKGTTNGHYHVSPGVFNKYKFFHWNMRGNSVPVPVETEYNTDNKELVVKCDKLEDSCIVFQSLRDEQPYNYVRPILYDHEGSWIYKTNHIYSIDVVLNCIEVASEHKVYYAMFYPIRRLVTCQKDLFAIFRGLCERKLFVLKAEDYENLHRFAHEFCFEWILLSRGQWIKLSRVDKRMMKIIEKLFRTTPFVRKETDWIERVIEVYFMELNMGFRRDNNSAAGLVLQCLRCNRGDMQIIIDDYLKRIEMLELIYKDTSICYHLYQKLNNIINNSL